MAQLAVSASSRDYILSCLTTRIYKDTSEADLVALTKTVLMFLDALASSGDSSLVVGYLNVAVATSPVCALAMEHICRHHREYRLFVADSTRFIAEHGLF